MQDTHPLLDILANLVIKLETRLKLFKLLLIDIILLQRLGGFGRSKEVEE